LLNVVLDAVDSAANGITVFRMLGEQGHELAGLHHSLYG